ncbi:hypothetical protein HDU96_008195 [Phlyctochytrium bullatum]|nr:hypothetical protein HDU96_008195 [Phlyctochytrium bullatum]
MQLRRRHLQHRVDVENASQELPSGSDKAAPQLSTDKASEPVLPTYDSQTRLTFFPPSPRLPPPYPRELESEKLIPAYEALVRLEEARSNGSLGSRHPNESTQKFQTALSSADGGTGESKSDGPASVARGNEDAVEEGGVAGSTSLTTPPVMPHMPSLQLSPAAYALLRNDHAFLSAISTAMACIATVHLGWTLPPSDPTLITRPSAATWLPPVVGGCAAYMIAGALVEDLLVVVESWWGVPVGFNRKRPPATQHLIAAGFGVVFWIMFCGEGKLFDLVNEVQG